MRIRIIPRLDIKGDNLVKGVTMEGLRVLGKPQDFARIYYEEGADELLLVDVVASLYGRGSIIPVIEKTAKEIFIPLTVAGGIRTLEDISAVLRAGADKVALNSAAIKNPKILSDAVSRYGSSTIVLSIEVGRSLNGQYEALIEYGRQTTGVPALEWLQRAAELGVGEVLVTSVYREGTGKGLDIELLKKCSDLASIPIIAGGGVGNCAHVLEAVLNSKTNAVSIAGALHYHYVKSMQIDPSNYANEGNIKFLLSQQKENSQKGFSLIELKQFLRSHNVQSRSIV
jgi:cyclase